MPKWRWLLGHLNEKLWFHATLFCVVGVFTALFAPLVKDYIPEDYARSIGADFAYMGTRFISTTESGAVEGYKAMICDSEAADIVYTPVVSGVPGNFFRQRLKT